MKQTLLLAAALAALSACTANEDSPQSNDTTTTSDRASEGALAPASTAPDGTPAPEGNDPPAPPVDEEDSAPPAGNQADEDSDDSADAAIIPAQYRGRWGLVPGDCTSTRGDAKGLMIVRRNTIRFYESTATLREQRPAIATSFSGEYDFAGEGQTWERVITLTRTGNTLKRAQEDGTFTYKRCA